MFIVEERVELKDAENTRLALLAAIDAHEAGCFAFDLSGTAPSQVALQLSLAGLKELETRGIEPQFGFALATILDQNVSAQAEG
ncbi:hypothetical protein [Yoonia sediminilitoris]|uniref:Uncharacterized protein n=1 Tax=Yoonia sediminilitoris TaxID=1286148 RepID=A0A2T6KKF7_9RHOB|nr:hypothetical protein [Yoonia sediminilitoris]PUB16436.1 hypothetical protein C8N45_103293 [Yoonia sediminilitoris]RCW96785.1 hypothetical protein DFP92_103293 [Yoonia sediminilitoris]